MTFCSTLMSYRLQQTLETADPLGGHIDDHATRLRITDGSDPLCIFHECHPFYGPYLTDTKGNRAA